MHVSVRSYLTAGVATITAATLAFLPSVAGSAPQSMQAPTPIVRASSAPFHLAAAVQSTAPLPELLTDWLQSTVVPSSAPAAVGASVDSAIKNVYDAIEPWVRYGFEVATYAVGWVPVVGWLAPQIMIFYNFGERIARSATFNVADFLGGNVSFVQGVGNVAVDTINSFITLANDELAFFLPPLPPIPPIGALAAAEPSVLKVSGVEAPTRQPAVKGPLANLTALATDFDEHVRALTKATPRDAVRALEAALNPVRTDVTKDPGTEPTTEPARTPAAINKFVKRLTAPTKRVDEKSSVSADAAGAQPSTPKPRHARKHATEASDSSAPAKADKSSGSKDRGHRGAGHVKAGPKD
jgi:hypothetical protein